MQPRLTSATRKQQSGFTLVELMTVVVIVGVLSALAVYGVRMYIQSTKSSEAGAIINAIRAAQEVYRQDTFVYLDVSAGNYANLHPSATPGNFKRSWAGDGDSVATSQGFRELGVTVDSGVYYSYGVVAGRTGETVPTPPTEKEDFGFPETAEQPFYVVIAKGDLDGDGTFSYMLAHSMSSDVYIEREGE
ncbi:MAG: fimbrial protein pilA [Pseudomonadota bacterium]|jgi:prepilin-type N-terminal cleavage/methylation domain-containing protein